MYQEKKEGLKMKICCACKKDKDINHFYKNVAYPDGREKRCKICKQSKITCRVLKPKKIKVVPKALILTNIKTEDWIQTFTFLESIGYKLDTQKSIHEQFCDKYGLNPIKRMYEKTIQYTPKDLGLV